MTRVRQVMYGHVKKKSKQSSLPTSSQPTDGCSSELGPLLNVLDKHWTSVSLPVVGGDNSHVF